MSTSDRELLELAARAAGVRHVDYADIDYDGSQGLMLVDDNGRHRHAWSPLEDDGSFDECREYIEQARAALEKKS